MNCQKKVDMMNFLIEMPPGGGFLPLQMTNQVRIGEGTGSSGASKSYTTLVIDTVIQTRFPVLHRASQSREVFHTLSFAVTANTTQTIPHSLNPSRQANDNGTNLISQMKGFAWLHLGFFRKLFKAAMAFQQCQASMMNERLLFAGWPTWRMRAAAVGCTGTRSDPHCCSHHQRPLWSQICCRSFSLHHGWFQNWVKGNQMKNKPQVFHITFQLSYETQIK